MTKWVPRYRVINIYLSHTQFPEQLEPLSTEYPTFVSSEEEVEDEGEGEGKGEDEEEVEAEDVEVQQENDNVATPINLGKGFRANEPSVEPEEAKLDDSDKLISLESDDGNESEDQCDRLKKKNHFPEFVEDKDMENP
ncbi:hypothetical protein LguiA_021205 [Lonicera macranthoides]